MLFRFLPVTNAVWKANCSMEGAVEGDASPEDYSDGPQWVRGPRASTYT